VNAQKGVDGILCLPVAGYFWTGPESSGFTTGGRSMQKSLLITISDDLSCLYGVRFVSSFFRNKSAMRITLFYVAPTATPTETGGRSGRHGKGAVISDAHRKKGQKTLDTSKGLLCDRGFSPDHVSSKLMAKEFGTVKDIIREARKGHYDAVVLGRRGYTIFESVMCNSVSKEIMDKNIDFPLWICRHPEEGRKNVLLCVDGSEASLRMADHVGFMLQDEEEHSVTLLTVDTGETSNIQAGLEEAKKKLTANGVHDGRIQSLVVRSPRVAKTILEETDRNSFGVVGMGRVGLQKGMMKEWLIGSRTVKLLENLEKAVLWVSR
jgi:nucleotide-binding universal stress UspA family protein